MNPHAWSDQGIINSSTTPNSTDKSQCQASDFSELNGEGGEGIRIDNPAHSFGDDGDQRDQDADDSPAQIPRLRRRLALNGRLAA